MRQLFSCVRLHAASQNAHERAEFLSFCRQEVVFPSAKKVPAAPAACHARCFPSSFQSFSQRVTHVFQKGMLLGAVTQPRASAASLLLFKPSLLKPPLFSHHTCHKAKAVSLSRCLPTAFLLRLRGLPSKAQPAFQAFHKATMLASLCRREPPPLTMPASHCHKQGKQGSRATSAFPASFLLLQPPLSHIYIYVTSMLSGHKPMSLSSCCCFPSPFSPTRQGLCLPGFLSEDTDRCFASLFAHVTPVTARQASCRSLLCLTFSCFLEWMMSVCKATKCLLMPHHHAFHASSLPFLLSCHASQPATLSCYAFPSLSLLASSFLLPNTSKVTKAIEEVIATMPSSHRAATAPACHEPVPACRLQQVFCCFFTAVPHAVASAFSSLLVKSFSFSDVSLSPASFLSQGPTSFLSSLEIQERLFPLSAFLSSKHMPHAAMPPPEPSRRASASHVNVKSFTQQLTAAFSSAAMPFKALLLSKRPGSVRPACLSGWPGCRRFGC